MARLRVFVLGTPRVELDGQIVHIDRQKAVALLAYLVVSRRPHAREWLATLLWPDTASSRAQLRIALSVLRQKLGDTWFLADREEIGLHHDLIESDVRDLLRISAAVEKGQLRPGVDLEVEQILATYPQDLLAGFTLRDAPEFDAWQRSEEQSLRSRCERMLDQAALQFMRTQDFASALRLVHRWVTINPFNEHARRQLMRLYAWTNQRPLAQREYQQMRAFIWQNDRAEPEPQTTALYREIQEGALIPMPAPVPMPSPARLPHVLPLIGRTAELETLLRIHAGGARLITVTGPGGIGKTHFAIAAAHQLESRFADGCCFVHMEEESSARSLLVALVNALSLYEMPIENVNDALLSFIQPKHLLIVIDNIHRAEGGPRLIQSILQRAPGVTFLLTSYQALELNAEYCFALQGLPLPQTGGDPGTALTLYVEEARRVLPSFDIGPESLPDIIRICQLVEGMPLAIKLAAAWSAVLTPAEIADEIAQNFDFLQVNHQDIPARHRSLRSVFESAWQWLTPDEQTALMNLAIFPGSFSRAAAETVSQVFLNTLKGLTTKALISYVPNRQRYHLHDVSRQYAGEKLARLGDWQQRRLAFCEYYTQYMENRLLALKGHLKEQSWREIDAEFANVQGAWRYLLETQNAALLERMVDPVRLYLQSRGLWQQGLLMFEAARQATAGSDNADVRRVHHRLLTRFYRMEHDFAMEHAQLLNGLQDALQRGDQYEAAYASGELGWNAMSYQYYAQAHAYFRSGLEHYPAGQEPYGAALHLRGLAYAAIGLRQHAESLGHVEDSLRLRRAIGDHEGEHETLVLRGELALISGDLASAEQDLQAALSYFAHHYHEPLALIRSYIVGWLHVFAFRPEQAEQFASQLLSIDSIGEIAPVHCSAQAMRFLLHALRGDGSAARQALDALEGQLLRVTTWPSTLNPDSLFFVRFAYVTGCVMLQRWEPARKVLRQMATDGLLLDPPYRQWTSPALILMLDAAGSQPIGELIEGFHHSTVAAMPWAQQWTALQSRLSRLEHTQHAEGGSLETALSSLLNLALS